MLQFFQFIFFIFLCFLEPVSAFGDTNKNHFTTRAVGKDLYLKELAFYEKSGDKSIMRFYNDAVNENLDDRIFIDF